MNSLTDNIAASVAVFAVPVLLAACGSADPVDPARYAVTDSFVQLMNDNLSRSDRLRKVAEIDHSRLAHEAGSPMPPSRVVIFSDSALEASLVQENPLVALDLPLRVLAFEQSGPGSDRIIHNSFDYLISRYQLDADAVRELRVIHERDIEEITRGIPKEAVTAFANDAMQPDGIVTIPSPYGFDETLQRVNAIIDAQDDTIHFGRVDFQASAREHGIEIPQSRMILFGAPGPGGRVMAGAITLGLDGFCQKLLVWQDAQGRTNVSFNDLVALAERQGLRKSIALRFVNYRVKQTFRDAVASD